MRPFIVVGDPTDHGGVVIGSTQTTDTFGKRLARVGDQVTCPKKGHGTTVIVTGDPTMIVDGAPVARHGDKCACGATLISSQVLSGVVEGGANSRAAEVSTWAAQVHAPDHPTAEFDQRFLLMNLHGHPMQDVPYVITLDSGTRWHGRTDASGLTDAVVSTCDEVATIEVLRDEPPINPTWDH